MALKRQHDMSATFSMASMTDVIFLLLIFFMVTSTFVLPNALEVNLPESSTQTTLKPTSRIYLSADGQTAYVDENGNEQMIEDDNQLRGYMHLIEQQEETPLVALHADVNVPYGRVVEVLNIGSELNVKIVLAANAPKVEQPFQPATPPTPEK